MKHEISTVIMDEIQFTVQNSTKL